MITNRSMAVAYHYGFCAVSQPCHGGLNFARAAGSNAGGHLLRTATSGKGAFRDDRPIGDRCVQFGGARWARRCTAVSVQSVQRPRHYWCIAAVPVAASPVHIACPRAQIAALLRGVGRWFAAAGGNPRASGGFGARSGTIGEHGESFHLHAILASLGARDRGTDQGICTDAYCAFAALSAVFHHHHRHFVADVRKGSAPSESYDARGYGVLLSDRCRIY